MACGCRPYHTADTADTADIADTAADTLVVNKLTRDPPDV